ncbi:protein kinase [candidate division CSSED10-310 bacterium]|uniref:Protein kinase n=1 Tax=candidate division CSSED10-310 bacterium TaxID=2855610 RepID=A0ABV6YWR3_UNCC1
MKSVGKYKIIEALGKGGMGIVYKAEDPVIERIVAIKLMTESTFSQQESKERFLREAQTIAQLRHPNIIELFDMGEYDQRPYFVMEYLEGHDLKYFLEAGINLPTLQLLDILIAVCSALEYSHQKDIVHRDIKPANIFVLNTGVVKLMDYGLAKISSSTLTKTGMILGTIHYISPEQIREKNIDQRTDIYSLGVVMYEIFSHERPFRGDSLTSILHKILYVEPQPFEPVDRKLPPEILPIMLKALSKDKDQRYHSASALAEDLKKVRAKCEVVTTELSDQRTAELISPQKSELQDDVSSVSKTKKIKRAVLDSKRQPSSPLTVVVKKKQTMKFWLPSVILFFVIFAVAGVSFISKQGPQKDEYQVLPTQDEYEALPHLPPQTPAPETEPLASPEHDPIETQSEIPSENTGVSPETAESPTTAQHKAVVKTPGHREPDQTTIHPEKPVTPNIDFLKLQGQHAFLKGQYKLCIAHMDKILSHEPNNTYALDMKAKARAFLPDEADTTPLGVEIMNMKQAFSQGNYDKCSAIVSNILAIEPGHAEALAYQKKIATLLKKHQEDETKINDTIRIVKLHLSKNNVVQALQISEELRADYPDNPKVMKLYQEVQQIRDELLKPTPIIIGIKHNAPHSVQSNTKCKLYMGIIKNYPHTKAWLHYRPAESKPWQKLRLKKLGSYLHGEIPAQEVNKPVLEYYFVVTDQNNSILYSGEKNSYRISVVD